MTLKTELHPNGLHCIPSYLSIGWPLHLLRLQMETFVSCFLSRSSSHFMLLPDVRSQYICIFCKVIILYLQIRSKKARNNYRTLMFPTGHSYKYRYNSTVIQSFTYFCAKDPNAIKSSASSFLWVIRRRSAWSVYMLQHVISISLHSQGILQIYCLHVACSLFSFLILPLETQTF